jgi:hypothetical protein
MIRPIHPRFMANVLAQALHAKAWHDHIHRRYFSEQRNSVPAARRNCP